MTARQIKVGDTVWPRADSTCALFGPHTVIGTWQSPTIAGLWLWLIGHDDPNGYSPRTIHQSQWTLEQPNGSHPRPFDALTLGCAVLHRDRHGNVIPCPDQAH